MTKRSYFHRGGATPLLGLTVDAFFKGVVARFGRREALVSLPQNIRLTYRELDDEVNRVARGLMALGVARGQRVGIWSTDNAEWILIQLAAVRIGAVLVNVNPAYRTAELKHALTKAHIQYLVLIPSFRKSNYVEMLTELAPELKTITADQLQAAQLPDLRRVVLYDPEDAVHTRAPHPGFLPWGEFLDRGRDVSDDEVAARSDSLDPDDPVNIQFTSGTTGFPKGVVLTHHNVLNNGYFVGKRLKFTEHDRLCVPVPFYHCFGMVVSNLACLTHGACIVIPAPHFDVGATLRAIDEERCTALHGVPTMFVAELESPDRSKYNLSSLRTGIMAGAPCPPEIVRRVMEDLHCAEILIAYGMTESSPVTHITATDDSFERRTQTVGVNLDHQEVKIVDPETDEMVPLGEPGEVCFRGYHVMREYYEDPAGTNEAIDGAGWLHSGDLGVMDEHGYLRITGRLKDMIIRGGENIYPAEIEAHFYEHADIEQIAVFGVPDETYGEQVGAWVKLHEGSTVDVESIREWAKSRLAHYKIPRYIWIVDEFPMTVTGKVQKFRIREILQQWMAEGVPQPA